MLRGSITENGLRVKVLAKMAMGVARVSRIAHRTTRPRARTSILLLLLVGLAGCPGKTTVPLATVPFDVSRFGHSVRIPVTVTPENANLDYTYILGVFLWNPDHEQDLRTLSSHPPRTRLYLRVRVWQMVDGKEVSISVRDRDFDYDIKTKTFSFPPSMSERKTDIAYVNTSGRRGDIYDMESVHFRFPDHGQYYVDVETIADTPLIHGIPNWLTVQRDLPHGK
jgi:hypothetical protein